MRKAGKIFTIIGLFLSIAGFIAIGILVIYDKINKLDYLTDELRSRLVAILIYLYAISILSVIPINKRINVINIVGALACAVTIYQTYGIVTFSLIGFIINTIYRIVEWKKEKNNQGKLIVSPEEDNLTQNHVSSYIDEVDYASHVRKFMAFYIVSMVLSVAYIILIIKLFISDMINMYDTGNDVGKTIFNMIFYFTGPLAVIMAMLVVMIFIGGFVVSVLAIKKPCKTTLVCNIVVGLVTFTIFNTIASIIILNRTENETISSKTY